MTLKPHVPPQSLTELFFLFFLANKTFVCWLSHSSRSYFATLDLSLTYSNQHRDHRFPLKFAFITQAKQKAPGGRKKSYGHSGILSAADGVLADLKANGILTTLLEPEKVRSKSLEIMRNRRSGHLPRAQSERPVTQTMQRRRNLDDALSDAEKGMAGPSQRQVQI